MVVKMKRLEILLYHRERDKFLADLKKLGAVHIVEEDQVAEAPDVQKASAELRRGERVLGLLQKMAKTRSQASALQKAAYTPEALIDHFEELEGLVEKGNQDIAALQKDIKTLEPWGDFNPQSVKDLQEAGIRIRFFSASEKVYGELDRKAVTIEEIARSDRQVYFVVVERGGESIAVQADEVRLPEASLTEIKKQLAHIESAIVKYQSEMEALSWHTGELVEYINIRKEELAHTRAMLSMPQHAAGTVLYLKGWFPAKKEKAITRLLRDFTVWFKISDPQPDDAIPVLVQNGPFAKLFEPILKIYSLPDYFELDPTPFFAPFFTIFVGLCLGDLGYGLILLLLGSIVAIKAPATLRPIALLVVILGFSTSVAGILLNGFFGHTLFGGPGVAPGSAFFPTGAQIFSPLGAVQTDKGQSFPMMSFALVIGVVQIFVGMIIKALNQILQGCFAGAIQPLASLVMLLATFMLAANAHMMNLDQLTIGPLHIGTLLTSFPTPVLKWSLITALVLFFLFNNLQMKIFFRPLMGLWEFYQFAGGIVGNILSYIRLFALGLAGGLLGAAFNFIAFMFITKDGQVNFATPAVIATLVVLIFGHAINLALSMIGSFVHPLRLTFVEFYGNLGFKGGGKSYSPFRQLTTAENPNNQS